ncbi:hypothetical protein THUN1379_12390 [Paludibacterium sp. THUN1379]|uniref:GNAT family N-acetyltransferase n=1 Tax=Paludibacterium sp. THUN1379 TaxID=3112107 RepID=UPI00308F3E44|nr:hypothetical protein THUN1379_12390 [Paludibacterium sp. THUN1379]
MTLTEHALPPDGFLSGFADDEIFYRAFAEGCLPGFEHGFFSIEQDGRRLCTLPYFVTDFQLNTMLSDGWLKPALAWLTVPMACVGHPVADFGRVEGELTPEITRLVSDRLKQKGQLIAWKGYGADLALPEFTRVVGLPVPVLKLNGNYYGSLRSDKRNLLKRKLNKASALRYVLHDGLPEAELERLYALYLQTWQKAPVKFGRLEPAYFRRTSASSTYLLFYQDDRLIGFTQLLGKGDQMMNMFIGMDYAHSHEHGLYFAMFIRSVEVAQARGCREIELGATSYGFKRTLGATDHPTWNYFFHQSPWVNWLLAKLRRVLEPSADELK